MFAKKKRLRKELDIKATLKSPKKTYTKYLSLKAKKNDLDYNRYTVIISKKVAKFAVTRNLKKRKIRAVLEELDSKISQGYDIIVLCQKGIETQDFISIKKNILYLLKKTELIN